MCLLQLWHLRTERLRSSQYGTTHDIQSLMQSLQKSSLQNVHVLSARSFAVHIVSCRMHMTFEHCLQRSRHVQHTVSLHEIHESMSPTPHFFDELFLEHWPQKHVPQTAHIVEALHFEHAWHWDNSSIWSTVSTASPSLIHFNNSCLAINSKSKRLAWLQKM